jgi:hypothetical protein
MSASSFACLLLPLHVPDGVPELSLSLARSYLALTRHDAPKPNRTGASACTIYQEKSPISHRKKRCIPQKEKITEASPARRHRVELGRIFGHHMITRTEIHIACVFVRFSRVSENPVDVCVCVACAVCVCVCGCVCAGLHPHPNTHTHTHTHIYMYSAAAANQMAAGASSEANILKRQCLVYFLDKVPVLTFEKVCSQQR